MYIVQTKEEKYIVLYCIILFTFVLKVCYLKMDCYRIKWKISEKHRTR